jgi:hypothetical protein
VHSHCLGQQGVSRAAGTAMCCLDYRIVIKSGMTLGLGFGVVAFKQQVCMLFVCV